MMGIWPGCITFAVQIERMKKVISLLTLVLMCSSCGEYNKILKSTDYELKYSYAKKYFNQKKYARSATLLEEVVTILRGTSSAEESLYLLAQSYYGQKDYQTAAEYFKTYYTTYPKGEYAEQARFYSGYGLYQDAADPRLDQKQTYEAIAQLELYMEYYPQSERAKQAQEILFELQEKLAYKELISTQLYYNLGTYMGNNYRACVITADNALKDYPYSKYREEFILLKIKAKYELALASVEDRLQGRYRDVVDEYYNYVNEYPEGKYTKQVKKYFDYASKRISKSY
jgi:outer membrane protein assembly factor BamD